METNNDTLELRLTTDKPAYKIGDTLTADLRFKNNGTDEACVYLVMSEMFRCGQSELVLASKSVAKPVALFSPPPYPHGYVVTETDFHFIRPGEERRFEQTLFIDPERITEAGKYTLEWTYENRIDSWPGGIETLDGPTNELFDGKKIPGIWLGKTVRTIPLDIIR